jgi:hypothetical protein
MAFTGQVIELRVGQARHHVLPVDERHDVVGVAVPPADRDLHLVEPESPVPGEQDDVGERGSQLLAAAVEQVVEEHRLKFRAHQQAAVGFGRYSRKRIKRRGGNRPDQPDQADRSPPDRKSGDFKQRRDRRAERHHATADRVGAHGRRNAAQHPDRHHAIRHRRRAAQRVRAAAGQADDGHLLDAQGVGHCAQVVGECDDRVVLVGRGGADAGPVDADQPDVVLLGIDAGLGRDLPPRTRGAVQPEDRASLRVTELGEPELTIVADRNVAFQLRTSNGGNHYRSVT